MIFGQSFFSKFPFVQQNSLNPVFIQKPFSNVKDTTLRPQSCCLAKQTKPNVSNYLRYLRPRHHRIGTVASSASSLARSGAHDSFPKCGQRQCAHQWISTKLCHLSRDTFGIQHVIVIIFLTCQVRLGLDQVRLGPMTDEMLPRQCTHQWIFTKLCHLSRDTLSTQHFGVIIFLVYQVAYCQSLKGRNRRGDRCDRGRT